MLRVCKIKRPLPSKYCVLPRVTYPDKGDLVGGGVLYCLHVKNICCLFI
jgi:hypothetical protein